jgi:predicted nucleic acid-binding protein
MLVDSSVWIDHFRRHDASLAVALEDGLVECHDFVIGELACGHLRQGTTILSLMQSLPRVRPVAHDEALSFLEMHALGGTGLGWVDVHLLAAARLAGTSLWTRDRRLLTAAQRLGLVHGRGPHR